MATLGGQLLLDLPNARACPSANPHIILQPQLLPPQATLNVPIGFAPLLNNF